MTLLLSNVYPSFLACSLFELASLLTSFFSIPNADPSLLEPAIKLRGRSLMPYCHFELEDSDYLTTSRRGDKQEQNSAQPGQTIDPNTRVVEFKSIGVNVKNQK